MLRSDGRGTAVLGLEGGEWWYKLYILISLWGLVIYA